MPIYFEEHINGCFVCISHRRDLRGNYPRLSVKNKNTVMHRYIYEKHFGPIPVGLQIRHTCDNPKCINPAHLLIGTHYDNVLDRIERGYSFKGEGHPNAKLTETQVHEIRKDVKSSRLALAEKYSVCRGTINEIKNRVTWTHI